MAGLSACTKCYSRQPFEELSKEEHLCKGCRRKYPLTACSYCQLEFHILQKIDGSRVCSKCSHNLTAYGKPKNCKYCQVKAAFKNQCCSRCISAEKRYGAPKQCQKCKKNAAFDKGIESQSKVGGQILCLHCTLDYKRIRHKHQKEQRKEKHGQSKQFSGSLSNSNVAPLKAENLAVSLKTRMEAVERNSRQGSRSSSPFRPLGAQDSASENTVDPNFGDQMSEITKLRDQIAGLKKVISQKEKIILEKDKKISEFMAEQWEKDKQWRQKLQIIQKDSNVTIETLQVENNSLKKQVARLSSTRKSTKYERPTTKIRLEPHKLGTDLSSSEKKNNASYDSPAESESIEMSSALSDDKTDESTVNSQPGTQESATEAKVDERVEDEVEDKNHDQVEETLTKGGELEEDDDEEEEDGKDVKTDAEVKASMSFDEAQEAGIKDILKLNADDENASSGRDEADHAIRQNSKKRRKRKSKLTVEDDEEDDDDKKISVKKKRKKKSRRIIDENEDEERNNNVEENSPEAKSDTAGDDDDDAMFAPTDPDDEEQDVDSSQPSGQNSDDEEGRKDLEEKVEVHEAEEQRDGDFKDDASVSSASSDSDDSSDKLQVDE